MNYTTYFSFTLIKWQYMGQLCAIYYVYTIITQSKFFNRLHPQLKIVAKTVLYLLSSLSNFVKFPKILFLNKNVGRCSPTNIFPDVSNSSFLTFFLLYNLQYNNRFQTFNWRIYNTILIYCVQKQIIFYYLRVK